MILGRSPALFAAAIAAILNAVVLVGLVSLTSAQIAGLNVAAGAVIALIAGSPITDHPALAAAAAQRAVRRAAKSR